MKTYNVKEISEMLNTNPETVRRWIRSGKLKATQDSRKEGNVVTEQMLHTFLKSSPKYAAMASKALSPTVGLTVLTASLIGGLLSRQFVEIEKEKNAKISTAEIKKLLENEVMTRKNSIKRKKEAIRQLQNEVENEQTSINELLCLITEINDQKREQEKGGI
jgi:excisionase family DNA binding protein